MAKKQSKSKRMTRGKSRGRSSALRQPNLDVTRGHVPPRNFLATHVAGFPQHQRQTLSFSAELILTNPASTFLDHPIVANGAFQPDVAFTGTPATGYSKYMAVYTKCFVQGARIRAHFGNLPALIGTPPVLQPLAQIYGITVTTNTTSLGTQTAAVDAGLSQYKVVVLNPDVCTFTQSIDIGKFVDKPDLLDDPQFFSTVSANPTQVVVFHLWNLNTSTTAVAATLLAYDVEFDCIFTDPAPFT